MDTEFIQMFIQFGEAVKNFFTFASTAAPGTPPPGIENSGFIADILAALKGVDPQTAFFGLMGIGLIITIVQKLFKVAIAIASVAVVFIVLKYLGVLPA